MNPQPNDGPAPYFPRGPRIAILVFIALATLLVSALVWTRRWNIGIPNEWQWEYFVKPRNCVAAVPVLVYCALLAITVGGCMRRGLAERRNEIIGVGLCMALALGVIFETAEAAPVASYDAWTFGSTVAPGAGGYYLESLRVPDMGAYLKGYAGMISRMKVNDIIRGHIADHPAGPVAFHWVVNHALDRWPAAAHWFIPAGMKKPGDVSAGEFGGIWASAFLFRLAYWLTLLLIYALVRDLYSREAGLLALALSALIPSLHLFSPYPDLLMPLFAVGIFYAWHRALRCSCVCWAALSGALTAVGMLWSMSLLAAVALIGAYSLLGAWRGGPGRRGWLLAIFGWAAGFVISSLIPTLLFGYDTWSVWRICLSQHAKFALLFPRSYWAWTLFNPVEFAVFAGLPVFLLLMATAVADVRRWWPARRHQALSSLPWALLVVLAALDLSGKNLGEVARLWMFLMPFAAAAGACALAALDGKRGWIAASVLALAAIQLTVFRLSLNTFNVIGL